MELRNLELGDLPLYEAIHCDPAMMEHLGGPLPREGLAELKDAGLVDREVLDGPPIATVYRLTERGEALRPALLALGAWAEAHLLAADQRS